MKKVIIGGLVIGATLIAVTYLSIGGNTPNAHPLQAFATGKMANFAVETSPEAAPDLPVTDAEGQQVRLSDYRGQVLLVNFWATWCAPCRHEMPALERLQKELGGDDFQVLIVSMDRGGLEPSQKFLDDIGVTALSPLIDQRSTLGRAMGAFGLPTTVLIDRKGRDIGRLVGPAEWDTPDAIALIQNAL